MNLCVQINIQIEDLDSGFKPACPIESHFEFKFTGLDRTKVSFVRRNNARSKKHDKLVGIIYGQTLFIAKFLASLATWPIPMRYRIISASLQFSGFSQ
jgi:hypothetical protein